MDPEIRVDTEQMCVERSVVRLCERKPVLHHGLPELLVLVLDDVGGIEEHRLMQT